MDFPKSVPNIGLVSGLFVDENQTTGTPGSLIPSVWGNSITQEVLNVITAAGLTPSEVDVTQLLKSIRAIIKQPVMLTDTGTAGAYKAVNSPALTAFPVNGFIQCVNISNTNPGPATYQPDGLAPKTIYGLALSPLQGGELTSGPAVLMYLIQAGVNSGNGAWIVLYSVGGASQVPAATKSLQAVQFGQVSGVVGQAKNLKASITVAASTATFTADEIVLETALGGLRYCIANFNQSINLAGVNGTNAMDTGQAPVGGFVAVYAVCTAGGTARLLGQNATSVVAPPVYAGSFMPSGYIASALISVVPTNASRFFIAFSQVNNRISTARQNFFGGSTILTVSPISISAVAPPNAIRLSGIIGATCTAASNIGLTLFSSAAQAGEQNVNGTVSATGGVGSVFSLNISAQQTVYVSTTNITGTPSFSAFATEYEI